MKNLDELVKALTEITESNADVKSYFEKISKALLCDCIIVKGKKEYRIREIEFYLLRPDYRDAVTYPRSCNAGDWFFHNSGVDLSFKSMCSISKADTTLDRFGGVLIRTVERISADGEGKTLFDGPIKVVNELFDQFSAISPSIDTPHLFVSENRFSDENRNPVGRYHIPTSKDEIIVNECSYYSIDGLMLKSKATKGSSYYNLIVNNG